MILREARPDDAAALCAAERAVVLEHDGLLVSEPDELNEEAFRARIASLADGSGRYLVLEEGGHLLAHASLWPMGLRKVSHVLRLDMCVHLGYWRQGHGQHLLNALIEWARSNPRALKIELLVRATNHPAISLYQRVGFQVEGRMENRMRLRSGQLIDDLSMALHLRNAAGEAHINDGEH